MTFCGRPIYRLRQWTGICGDLPDRHAGDALWRAASAAAEQAAAEAGGCGVSDVCVGQVILEFAGVRGARQCLLCPKRKKLDAADAELVP